MKAQLRKLIGEGRYPFSVGCLAVGIGFYAAMQLIRGCGPDPEEARRRALTPAPGTEWHRRATWPDDEEAIVIDPTAPDGQRVTTWGEAREWGLAPRPGTPAPRP